jgi:hypothetical protein
VRSLAPIAVSAASMTLFGPSGTTSGAGNAIVSAVPRPPQFAPPKRGELPNLVIFKY